MSFVIHAQDDGGSSGGDSGGGDSGGGDSGGDNGGEGGGDPGDPGGDGGAEPAPDAPNDTPDSAPEEAPPDAQEEAAPEEDPDPASESGGGVGTGGGSVNVDGNQVSMSGVNPADVAISNSTGYAASWDPSTGAISVTGPEGYTASVTQDPVTGGYNVSFSPPGGAEAEASSESGAVVDSGDSGGGNEGNSGGGGDSEVVPGGPPPSPGYPTVPVFAGNASCDPGQPKVDLAWNSANTQSYEVYAQGLSNPIYTGTGRSYTHMVNPLDNGRQNYSYTVRAFNSSGEAQNSVTLNLPNCAFPEAAYIYVPQPSCQGPSASRLTVRIDQPRNADYYNIELIRAGRDNDWILRGGFDNDSFSGNVYYFTDQPVYPAAYYVYRVKSYNRNIPNWENYPAMSYHAADEKDVQGNQMQGSYHSGWQLSSNCEPPPAFSLTETIPACVGNRSYFNLRWTEAQNTNQAATRYRVIVQNSQGVLGDASTYLTTYPHEVSSELQYQYNVEASNQYGASYTGWTAWFTSLNCTPPGIYPTLTSNGRTTTLSDPPLPIKQNEPVTIAWTTANVPAAPDACTGSIPAQLPNGKSTPANILNIWNGNKLNAGSIDLPAITTVGKYPFTLRCTNSQGPNSATITLSVNQLQKPYIQTTGGDVHTNESIYISQ